MTSPALDEPRARLFAERMIDAVNGGAIALMASVGHRTGLFDVMAARPPSTPAEIAAAAGLDERYVREWLGAMATGRIVEVDRASDTYVLPPEHAASLTRAAGGRNRALQAQYVALLAGVEDRIVECFRRGGGVPYEAFPRFQAVMADESAAVHDAALLDVMLPLVPGLTDRLRRGADVLDVGCGRGHAVNLMARAFPRSRLLGYDLAAEAIGAARAEADAMRLENARFEVRDVTHLDVADGFDLVTAFDAIHDLARPDAVLAGIARALRPDGVFLMVDTAARSHPADNLDHPLGPFLYTVSCMHCMTVSLANGGVGLGTMWGEETARRMLAEAGFARVDVVHVESDPVNAHYVARKH